MSFQAERQHGVFPFPLCTLPPHKIAWCKQSTAKMESPSLTNFSLLTDPYFPRPIISLGPTELVAFGGNVTFQCQSKKFSTRFYSQKSGEEMLQPCLGTDETTAQCFVSNVDHAHMGEYSCRYSESKPFIISKTSKLVRLLMTGKRVNFAFTYLSHDLLFIWGLGAPCPLRNKLPLSSMRLIPR